MTECNKRLANQGLGFTVPYRMGGESRPYVPDFIVRVDDGHGADDPLNLVVEVKGYRREDAKVKKQTMENYWVPAVNRLVDQGRWAFVELKDVYTMRGDVDGAVEAVVTEAQAPLLSSRPPPTGWRRREPADPNVKDVPRRRSALAGDPAALPPRRRLNGVRHWDAAVQPE